MRIMYDGNYNRLEKELTSKGFTIICAYSEQETTTPLWVETKELKKDVAFHIGGMTTIANKKETKCTK